jgi:hypothetical protein
VSSKGGSGRQIVGYRYVMAQHSGISRGPVNEFCEIRVGDLAVWAGGITESGYDQINAPDAFGGDEKEGGIVGPFKVFMGEATQTIDSIITDQIEGGQPVPAGAGCSRCSFTGRSGRTTRTRKAGSSGSGEPPRGGTMMTRGTPTRH